MPVAEVPFTEIVAVGGGVSAFTGIKIIRMIRRSGKRYIAFERMFDLNSKKRK